jgi:hypothetical protein
MNRTIWKFPLMVLDDQDIEMPKGSRALSAGLDPQGTLCIWAEVDPESPTIPRKVSIRVTGHPLQARALCACAQRFLGSVLMGRLVWHVYCDDD